MHPTGLRAQRVSSGRCPSLLYVTQSVCLVNPLANSSGLGKQSGRGTPSSRSLNQRLQACAPRTANGQRRHQQRRPVARSRTQGMRARRASGSGSCFQDQTLHERGFTTSRGVETCEHSTRIESAHRAHTPSLRAFCSPTRRGSARAKEGASGGAQLHHLPRRLRNVFVKMPKCTLYFSWKWRPSCSSLHPAPCPATPNNEVRDFADLDGISTRKIFSSQRPPLQRFG